MKVEMYHPGIDRVVDVSPRQARVLARSGWARCLGDAEALALLEQDETSEMHHEEEEGS